MLSETNKLSQGYSGRRHERRQAVRRYLNNQAVYLFTPPDWPNRAARQRSLHEAKHDARLLSRVAHAALRRRPKGYKDERAATYGLEHEAARMATKRLLSRAELARVRHLAALRRKALAEQTEMGV